MTANDSIGTTRGTQTFILHITIITKFIIRSVRIIDKTRNGLYNLHCSHETTYRYTVVLCPFHDIICMKIIFKEEFF